MNYVHAHLSKRGSSVESVQGNERGNVGHEHRDSSGSNLICV